MHSFGKIHLINRAAMPGERSNFLNAASISLQFAPCHAIIPIPAMRQRALRFGNNRPKNR
jgi:hypothetical protein